MATLHDTQFWPKKWSYVKTQMAHNHRTLNKCRVLNTLYSTLIRNDDKSK